MSITRTTWQGLNTAMSALRSSQAALDAVGHNIANSAVEGYSRQRVDLETVGGIPVSINNKWPGGGAGVNTLGFSRQRDALADRLVWERQPAAQYAQTRADYYSQIEELYPEPSDTGLRSVLDKFWASWQDLSSAPTSIAARQSVIESGRVLATALNQHNARLDSLHGQASAEFDMTVDEVNTLAREIDKVNKNIVTGVKLGDNVNEMLDTRDRLLDKLSKLGDAQITVTPGTQELSVTFAGFTLIDATGDAHAITEADMTALSTGKLAALKGLRDTVIPSYQNDLDALAAAIIATVNDQHDNGFDLNGNPGGAFFTGTDASDIAINATLNGDPRLVAASNSATGVGNGDNALAISNLKSRAGVIGSLSIGDAFTATVSRLGVEAQEVNRQEIVQTASLSAALGRRDQTAGVSLDEEMANLLRFQRCYGAAARALTAYDELLNKLINGTGKVGL